MYLIWDKKKSKNNNKNQQQKNKKQKQQQQQKKKPKKERKVRASLLSATPSIQYHAAVLSHLHHIPFPYSSGDFFSSPSRNWDRNLEHLVGLPPTHRPPMTSTKGVWLSGNENREPMEE